METLITRTLVSELPSDGRPAAPSPAFAVSYNGKGISDSIAPLLLSITYTDKTDGEADELEIELEDTAGNWKRNWYPDKGAVLVAKVGWPDRMLACGEFEIDEVTQAGPPSVVTLRGLAAGLAKKTLRTKRSKAHENQTLRQIAERVAATHGLKVAGTIRPITIERATQRASRDLKFLKKLALEYGYIFSVRGGQLIFADVYELEGAKPILTIEEADVSDYSFLDKITRTYSSAEVKYHNPKNKKLSHGKVTATGQTAADVLHIIRKSENATQAAAQAKAALHRKNTRGTEATITTEGNPLLVAGVVIRIGTWAGRVAGLYYIVTSTHRINRTDGYATSINAKRIGN